jgi:hypothetical protein
MLNKPETFAEEKEENRSKRRHQKKNPKMKVSGRGMKRFAKPKK